MLKNTQNQQDMLQNLSQEDDLDRFIQSQFHENDSQNIFDDNTGIHEKFCQDEKENKKHASIKKPEKQINNLKKVTIDQQLDQFKKRPPQIITKQVPLAEHPLKKQEIQTKPIQKAPIQVQQVKKQIPVKTPQTVMEAEDEQSKSDIICDEEQEMQISPDQQVQTKVSKKKTPMYKTIQPQHIRITDISIPKRNQNKIFKNIKYTLQFTFENTQKPGKFHTKTVRIGSVKEKDMIDMEKQKSQDGEQGNVNNKMEMYKRLSKLKYHNNPLHPHFWTFHLLNGNGNGIQENYYNLVKNLQLF